MTRSLSVILLGLAAVAGCGRPDELEHIEVAVDSSGRIHLLTLAIEPIDAQSTRRGRGYP